MVHKYMDIERIERGIVHSVGINASTGKCRTQTQDKTAYNIWSWVKFLGGVGWVSSWNMKLFKSSAWHTQVKANQQPTKRTFRLPLWVRTKERYRFSSVAENIFVMCWLQQREEPPEEDSLWLEDMSVCVPMCVPMRMSRRMYLTRVGEKHGSGPKQSVQSVVTRYLL